LCFTSPQVRRANLTVHADNRLAFALPVARDLWDRSRVPRGRLGPRTSAGDPSSPRQLHRTQPPRGPRPETGPRHSASARDGPSHWARASARGAP